MNANEMIDQAVRRLADCGIGKSTPRSAAHCCAHALGGPGKLIDVSQGTLAIDKVARIENILAARETRMPFAQIVGKKEFWSLPFIVSQDVLTPRPDSETLIEAACSLAATQAPLQILDLGTGSGCLLLAFLRECALGFGVGIDISAAALAIARQNATALGLGDRAQFCVADWNAPVLGSINGYFDIIFANPPYIGADDFADLAPEVADYEPRGALDGGVDGLDAYRAILSRMGQCLRPDGYGLLEVGAGQAGQVEQIAVRSNLTIADSFADIAGIERCLAVQIGNR